MKRIIRIFDTTLRDGEQSPGVTLSVSEKLEIAKQLARLGVDAIEAGFPITSQGDFEAVQAIANTVKGPTIVALARTTKADIDRAWEAIKGAQRPRIHVFIATSPIHMKYKLQKTPQEVLETAVQAVKRAKQYTEDVEFSAEDATRSDPNFLYEVIKAVIEVGATTINIPDTVGYTTPSEFKALLTGIIQNVPSISKVTLSVHCHNDLGLATANSLAAVEAGAQQIECTINGIGERAGNTALEEVVMALRVRQDIYGAVTGIDTEQIYRTSRLVSTLTGMVVQPNKAIVGANSFAHESGIHQDGVLKERTTYEIMKPQDIGLPSSRLVLGKHSGRHAFRDKLAEMGYNLSQEELDTAFAAFKELADKKKELTDRDIEALINEAVFSSKEMHEEAYKLQRFQVSCGNVSIPMASISLSKGNQDITEAAYGDGPIDALYKAVDRATGLNNTLLDYYLKAVTSGKDALGEVTVKVQNGDNVFVGLGVSTDIVEASLKAYLNAVNKIIRATSARPSSLPDQGSAKTG